MTLALNIYNTTTAKPFLKWAGGKTQLIGAIEKSLPTELVKQKFTYLEPFVGSGAVLFWMIDKYPNLKHAVINDINADLTNAYKIIATQPKALISILREFENDYHNFQLLDSKKEKYYYDKRDQFNQRTSDNIYHAALFIFLNRTCFNGLYRVNKSNQFNVPIGSYKKPTICDEDNIMAVSNRLQKVEILTGDFEKTLSHADSNSFFYLDPPYKPLSATSSFNSYARDEFNDSEKIRLRDFCNKLNVLNHTWILSNSDVKGKDTNDNFFDDLYSGFNIQRVDARRNINANPEKRGPLKELLINNYSNNINILEKAYGK